ncbi:MAG: inorganic phosphate transporter [Dehalococcoidia bacterium]|nr:inorganic phosphate transporter [Dehalococcoidia bacterium]
MPESLALLIGIIAVAIAFGIANGFNDAANAIATVIGTRSLSPRSAIIMAACFNFLGAATGSAVAITIGKNIISPEALTMNILLAGVGAVIIWAFMATRLGMPISLTHGLVAGLVGAGIATSGPNIIVWGVLGKVFSAVGIAPLLGFTAGFLTMVAIVWLFHKWILSKARRFFSNAQVAAAAFLSYSHGKNDGQMPIALISMALMVHYGSGEFDIPFWAVAASAISISLGTILGGWRVIQTLGLKMTTLRPAQGFAATASAAAVIEVASHLGIPVSTTHCISTAIMGAGTIKRFSAVRWGIARNIVLTWILTFPICGALGWLIASALKLLS